MNTPMNNPTDADIKSDVLKAHEHAMLSSEEITKAIARHKREHPGKKAAQPAKKQKNPSH